MKRHIILHKIIYSLLSQLESFTIELLENNGNFIIFLYTIYCMIAATLSLAIQ